jgi:hypothetical protein
MLQTSYSEESVILRAQIDAMLSILIVFGIGNKGILALWNAEAARDEPGRLRDAAQSVRRLFR